MPRDHAFETELTIAVPRPTVWTALVQPSGARRWMHGATVTSTWAPGASVAVEVRLEGDVRHDRGTVLDADAPALLRWNTWSAISRRPDTEADRSIITVRLSEPRAGATVLHLRHERLDVVAWHHVAVFWPVALGLLRDLLEGTARPAPIAFLD
ncbi:MAG: SRPBCC domain-containing protein [Chloroflexota bacterium]